MIKFIIMYVCLSAICFGQNIDTRAKIIGGDEYSIRMMQQLVNELEDFQWCNLKVDDITVDMNDLTHTNLAVVGEAKYTNGFLLSVEKLDITDILPAVAQNTHVDGNTTSASIRSRINLRDARVGFDVAANVTGDGVIRRYTGVMRYTQIQIQLTITKNMNTGELTVSWQLVILSGGTAVRMQYMPEDEISQILSLRFLPGSIWDSVVSWARDTMAPMLFKIVNRERESFPEVCFHC